MSLHLIETVESRQRMHLDRIVVSCCANHEVGDCDIPEPAASAESNPKDEGVVAPAAVESKVGYGASTSTDCDDIVTIAGVNDNVFHRTSSDAERRLTKALDADIAEVGRYGEVLTVGAAIQFERVGIEPAIDHVAPVAGIPYKVIVPGAAKKLVITGTADYEIIAMSTDDGVIASAARQTDSRQRPIGVVDHEGVVAILTDYLDKVGIRDGRLATGDRHGAVVDEDRPRDVATDCNRVVEVVAKYRQQALTGMEFRSNCHCRLPQMWLDARSLGTRMYWSEFGGFDLRRREIFGLVTVTKVFRAPCRATLMQRSPGRVPRPADTAATQRVFW
jgi:hypothetical protein